MKKKITLVVALALVLVVGVFGTLAYLTDSQSVTNTFTIGNVGITLAETEGGEDHQFKMIPGQTIRKDPVVTVDAGSEACWLFVKLDKAGSAVVGETNLSFDNYLTFEVDASWTQLMDNNGNAVAGVYYREQAAVAESTNPLPSYPVLKNNTVTVLNTVTNEMMTALTDTSAKLPTLTVTAYAIQKAGFETSPYGAWTEVSK